MSKDNLIVNSGHTLIASQIRPTTLHVDGTKIEVCDDQVVKLNGERVKDIRDIEVVVHALATAMMATVR